MNTISAPVIGICGGGNLAHAMAGWLGTRGLHVNILTRNPNQWGKSLSAIFPNGTTHHAPLGHISNHPEILKDCNLVLVAVPRFGIREVCHRIKPYLHREQGLAIVPGTPEVMEMAEDPSWTSTVSLMGIYKVPLICRTQEYGHSVSILGSRPLNRIWVAPGNNAEHWSAMLETLFDTPLTHLSSPWPFLLTNSNPLLHPSRCMSLFRHYREGMFYAARTFAFKLGQSLSMLIFTAVSTIGAGAETGYRIAAFGAAVFCMVGGIILVFYNEKKINGIIGGIVIKY